MENDPAFRPLAYFSMEVGLKESIPTYSGGLGVLAGDILKSAADLGVPMAGVILLYRKGYFVQEFNAIYPPPSLPINYSIHILRKLPIR